MTRFINDVKKYYNYTIYSARSELKSEVSNSYLNWIWWILEPLCFMAIYVFVFGFVFNAKEENFPIFIFVGITLWDFFNRNIKNSIKMVKNNKAIVSKVYIPKFILVLSKMLVNAFKMMISFIIVILMMICASVNINWNILYIIPIMLTLLVVNFGIMCILLHFGVFVEDLSNVVNIALRAIFYLTGIFYSIESRIPSPYSDIILKFNPMAFILSSARKCILYGEQPSISLLLFWLVIGLIISIIGVRLIYKNENSYVKVI